MQPLPVLRRTHLALLPAICLSLATFALGRAASAADSGAITGAIVDAVSGNPVEFVTVTLKNKNDGQAATASATDASGVFEFQKIPYGDYTLSYGILGTDHPQTTPLVIDAQHRALNLGKLTLAADRSIVQLDKLQITGRKQASYNTIDRKVYDVGKDIQSAGGSASDLLQNIPSVQVDIEGNVSLRGDSSVLILIDGRPSAMMGRNRAAVLEQMPADVIESIEIITNPSAKYKPDGTAGIINIRMKKTRATAIYAGSVRATVGNDSRYSLGVFSSANAGKLTYNLSAHLRRDYRPRDSENTTTDHDPATGAEIATTRKRTTESSRPLSRIFQADVDYAFTKNTSLGANISYNNRDLKRHATATTLATGLAPLDYDRVRYDPEYETDAEFSINAKHAFDGEDHEITIEIKHSKSNEQEDNRYANIYRSPLPPPAGYPAGLSPHDTQRIHVIDKATEIAIDYTLPFGEDSKLETGYNGTFERLDQDYAGQKTEAGALVPDADFTNRFLCDTDIHALYGTVAHKLGDFGFLAGLRYEHARIKADRRSHDASATNDYNRLYPSLHLAYELTDAHQLRASYSHRVNRPDADEMDPYVSAQDPYNLSAGNPRLRPEDVHSVEFGYQYHRNDTTLFATAYYRYRYNGITSVTRRQNPGDPYYDPLYPTRTLTTRENLSTSRSGGAELGAQARLHKTLAVNFSGNIYRNTIDAGNLGPAFSATRSVTAWDAKLNLDWELNKSTLIQCNSNYTAKRLTPQGYRKPAFQANVGLRRFFMDRRLSLIVSVSDIFDTLRENTHIETPEMTRDIVRRRNPRIFNIGLIYNFGKPARKQKDDLQFDNSGL